MADSAFSGLTAATALTGDDLFAITDDPSGTRTSKKITAQIVKSFCANGAITAGSDANTTMAVNTTYVVDMSSWATADRTYTLPATAAVGDLITVIVSAGNTSTFELILTAGSGDTLNGVAGGSTWSRLLITGEYVTMMCVTADADWMVVKDGRIAQNGVMRLSNSTSASETATVWTVPTSISGAWTADVNVGNICSTSNGRFLPRRNGNYRVDIRGYPLTSHTDSFSVQARKNGTTDLMAFDSIFVTSTASFPVRTTDVVALVAGDYLEYLFATGLGSIGLLSFSTAGQCPTAFGIEEILR